MSPRNAIVIVIDRLGAGYLGPYGNTWIETTTVNRLASESMLWQNAFADCPTLEGFYRAVSSGRHALATQPPSSRQLLMDSLTAAGVNTLLVTDEHQLAKQPFAEGFGQRISVPTVSSQTAADSLEDTQFAHTFATALECLDHLPSPFVLWLHLKGMAGTWDAPREFRERFADEEDPTPPAFVKPPDKLLPPDVDPDELLGASQAFAGQVALCDLCLATFLDSIHQLPGIENTLLIVSSPRGYPLGEHGGIGPCSDGLREEVLHVPLLLRLPQRSHAMRRFQALVYPADLHATLRRWFELEAGDENQDGFNLLNAADAPEVVIRECVVSTYAKERSLRTQAWFMRHVADQPAQLFVKPDDRWEVNEVADRRADVVEEGLQALAAFEELARADRLGDFPKLPAALVSPAE